MDQVALLDDRSCLPRETRGSPNGNKGESKKEKVATSHFTVRLRNGCQHDEGILSDFVISRVKFFQEQFVADL